MNDPFDVLSLEASLDDLKSLFRILDRQREAHPELDRNRFLLSLEHLLRSQAETDGVDPEDDAAFARWLDDDEDERGAVTPGKLLN